LSRRVVHKVAAGEGDEMSEMIERVAKAIWCVEHPAEEWEADKHYFDAARAAIAVMREPSLEMLEDAMDIDDCSLLAEWRAMIDSALAQPETEATTK